MHRTAVVHGHKNGGSFYFFFFWRQQYKDKEICTVRSGSYKCLINTHTKCACIWTRRQARTSYASKMSWKESMKFKYVSEQHISLLLPDRKQFREVIMSEANFNGSATFSITSKVQIKSCAQFVTISGSASVQRSAFSAQIANEKGTATTGMGV